MTEMRRWMRLLESTGSPKMRPSPEDLERIREVREQEREPSGGGHCHILSEWIEDEFGWPRQSGAYTDQNDDTICEAHYWNILPDGAILDATADQFGEGHDIRIIEPGDPEHARYRDEWYDDYHPGHPEHPHLAGRKWSGELDMDKVQRLERERGVGWWLAGKDRSHMDRYLDRDLPRRASDEWDAGFVSKWTKWRQGVSEAKAEQQGLEMDVSARLARARQLGFDTTTILYHGTGAAFTAFKRAYHGKNMGADQREPFAVWLTTSPEAANSYAERTTHDSHHFITGELLRKGEGSPNLLPLYVRADGFRIVDCSEWSHFQLLRQKGSILRYAKEGSRFYGGPVPGVIFKNAEDGVDHRSDVYAVFNPARVRSIFAAFDPAKKNSSDLLA